MYDITILKLSISLLGPSSAHVPVLYGSRFNEAPQRHHSNANELIRLDEAPVLHRELQFVVVRFVRFQDFPASGDNGIVSKKMVSSEAYK